MSAAGNGTEEVVELLDDSSSVKRVLPHWAYLHDFDKQLGGGEYLSEEVGPALKLMRVLSFLMVTSQAIFFCLVRMTAEQTSSGYPHYQLWVWVVVAPVSVFRMFVEFLSLRMVLGPYVKNALKAKVEPFKVMGHKASFHVWFTFSFVCSQLNLLDVQTDTLFASLASVGHDTWSKVWPTVWQQSLLHTAHLPIISLSVLVIACWACTFMQMIVPVLTTIRKDERLERGERGERPTCLTGTQLNNGNVLWELAEATGLASMQSLAITSAQCRVANREVRDALWRAAALSDQLVKRFFMAYIMENALQVNLQATILAISHYVRGHDEHNAHRQSRSESQACFSIVLGLFLTCVKLLEAQSFSTVVMMTENRVPEWEEVEGGLDETSKARLKELRANTRIVKILCVVLILSLFYGVAKIIAIFACEDALLNLTGCVDMPDHALS